MLHTRYPKDASLADFALQVVSDTEFALEMCASEAKHLFFRVSVEVDRTDQLVLHQDNVFVRPRMDSLKAGFGRGQEWVAIVTSVPFDER